MVQLRPDNDQGREAQYTHASWRKPLIIGCRTSVGYRRGGTSSLLRAGVSRCLRQYHAETTGYLSRSRFGFHAHGCVVCLCPLMIDLSTMDFPRILVEYVRVYRRKGQTHIGCDAPGYSTANYISRHLYSYSIVI